MRPEVADLTPENVGLLLGEADLVLDATDDFETRYLINDFAVKNCRPWIYAAAVMYLWAWLDRRREARRAVAESRALS